MQKLLFFIFISLTLFAKEPTFEFGIGLGSIIFPDYIGSKSIQTYTLPYPYVQYHTEYLSIDKDGIKGKIFGIDGLELDLSLSGSLPANSKNSKVREGMPNLDSTFEFGPRITYFIYHHGVAKLDFELPVRLVFSTDFTSISAQGLLSTPQIKYSLDYGALVFSLRSGIMVADEQYHSYFYELPKEYETPVRAAYKTSGGYSGFRNGAGVTYQKNNYLLGASLTHYDISGAVFRDSPLVETSHATYFGATVAYIFYTQP